MLHPASMVSRMEEAKGELLRVRREIVGIDEQLERVQKELERAPEVSEKEKDDMRAIRSTLWKEKEQLREQETLFLKTLFMEMPSMPAMNFSPNFSQNGTSLLPLLPRPAGLKPSQATARRGGRRRVNSIAHQTSPPGLPPGPMVDPHSADLLSFEADFTNEGGYEVNRSSECKVVDVWREWKDGLNGGPSIEKLEESRKRDRKMIWWKHKNDYKYWSKQMRIIHAIEQKAVEYGGNVEAGIQFWEEILRVEFEGSISKLREALGGEKMSAENREMGVVGEMHPSKRLRKELLQQGLERLKGWPDPQTAAGLI